MDTDELAKIIHKHVNQYISLADKKASILLTAQLAFLGLYANLLSGIWLSRGVLFHSLALISVAGGALSIFFAAGVVYPRTPSPGDGVFFWGDIRDRSLEQYIEDIAQMEPTDQTRSLIEEIHYLACVARKKYNWFRASMVSTAVWLIITGASMLFQ